MRKFMLTLTSFVAILIVILLSVYPAYKTEGKGKKNKKSTAAPPPASLDAFFPPNAEGPVYLFRMFGMTSPFIGIVTDLFENDMENAKANFENFKAQYLEISKLVPEWEAKFPTEPVEKLGTVLETGDPGQVMPVFERVGKICSNCHIANMVKVQQKYHWKDFGEITLHDPLLDQEVGFAQFMLFMDMSFIGIGVDVAQGQQENAQKQFQGFNARFQAMKTTCMTCHDTERKYYIDETVQGMIDKLGQALNEPSIDPKVIEELSQGIGMESCIKCHKVHLPAAFAKARWKKFERKKR